MSRFLVPMLLLSASAFAGNDEPALKGNVLVWNDAAFYTDAADDAQVVHAASLDSRSVGSVIAMKVISTKNGFVEVEPAAELDCTWARLQTSDDLAQLHLFVKRADLAPVLSTAFEKTYTDGSRVALKPGTPVTSADGKYAIGVHGSSDIALELPAQSVGWSYMPEKVKTGPTVLGGEFELAPKTKVSLADASIVIDGHRGIGVEQRGAQTVFSIKSKCAALDVVAPAKAVRAIDDDEEQTMEVSSGLAIMDLRNEDFIPQGTVLSTVGGRAFAAAAKPIYLSSVPHGKAACVDRKIKIGVFEGESLDPKDGDNKLKVCAPAGRVMHEQLRSARSANGTTHR